MGILQDSSTGWTGVTVTVVKPDGTTTTLGPFKTDGTGSTYTTFTPESVGTYRLTTNFPNNTISTGFLDMQRGVYIPAGTVLLASTSETLNLTVQTEAVPSYPQQPLPSSYWTLPIDSQLRDWYSISGTTSS